MAPVAVDGGRVGRRGDYALTPEPGDYAADAAASPTYAARGVVVGPGPVAVDGGLFGRRGDYALTPEPGDYAADAAASPTYAARGVVLVGGGRS